MQITIIYRKKEGNLIENQSLEMPNKNLAYFKIQIKKSLKTYLIKYNRLIILKIRIISKAFHANAS